MKWKASPRTSLYLALCACLILPACGEDSVEDTGSTGSGTQSNGTSSSSAQTGGQDTGSANTSGDGSSADSTTGTQTTGGSSGDSTTGGTTSDSTTGAETGTSSTGDSSSTDDSTTTGDSTGEKLTFKKHVLPVIKKTCSCHQSPSPADALDLRDDKAFASLVGTGKNGPGGVPYVKANDSAGSYLYLSVSRTATETENHMPPPSKDPLTTAQVKVFKDWIDSGAAEE